MAQGRTSECNDEPAARLVSRDAPLLAERLVDAINSDRQIEVHVWGSMGQSDMTMEVVGLCKPIAGV